MFIFYKSKLRLRKFKFLAHLVTLNLVKIESGFEATFCVGVCSCFIHHYNFSIFCSIQLPDLTGSGWP